MIAGRLRELVQPQPPWDNTAPVRGELFSIERLEGHGRSLAAAQSVAVRAPRVQPLARRLAENAAFLLQANRAITASAEDGREAGRQVTPAAEWLVDNYHLVDMQIREIGVDLPPGYYAQLPKLAGGPFAGLPRVFGAMWSLVAHTDSHFEPEALRRYLLAYQEVQPLTVGELWAVPITLRIVLIENLRRIAAIIVRNGADRQQADRLADRLVLAGEAPATLAAAGPAVLTDAFAVQLAHRLRGHDPKEDPALAWLDARLAEQNTSIAIVVQDEQQRQGASNAAIRNVINSLRQIAGIDWTEAFERVCLVNGVLAGQGAFLDMDFPTRNLYRTAIEQLARASRHTELDIARMAVDRARLATADGRDGDPGHHLFGQGRRAFEAALGARPPWAARFGRGCRQFGIAGYGGAVVLVAAAFLALPLWVLAGAGVGWPWLLLLGAAGAVLASDAAVACVNRLAMGVFGATFLPSLELRDGIPAPLRTLVAVPTLLTSAAAVAEQVARLEVHHLSSPDGELHFALLADWADSPTEHAPDDDALLAAATDGIARLNGRYGPAPGGVRFALLHRRRVWAASEGRWIGWERKRGKLHELNRLLRGAADTTFLPTAAPALPDGIRYVVTLDSDTRLPRDAVRRMVGKMAHPLNRPVLDPATGRVTEGYGLLQPRVTPALPVGRDSSLFQRVFSSMDGIDPYAGAVSDVYQDLFGEGSYAGKGIYDVDAFEAALAGRVPDATLLSHDLFEGVFARAGLASDIEVVEEFPARYAVSAMRQHRWARGDWQLLPWLMPWAARAARHGAIPAIGRWKMLDNLRRTLSAPSAVAALLLGWLLPFGPALAWTGFVLSTIALPALLPVLGDMWPGRRWVTVRSYLGLLGHGLRHAVLLVALTVAFLAHQACLMADAVVRTLVRVFVTRRNLLQWVTAAQAADGPALDTMGYYRAMAGAPVAGAVALGVAVVSGPWVWLLAAPFAGAWLLSPAIARQASLCSPASLRLRASQDDLRALRLAARRSWRFFETFVTPADHMLPPDNFQEDPSPVVARRTSPTNIGLYLLSAVSAHDFGWVGLLDTVERLEATLATMERMARFRGHLYNWYDTSDLRPLEPRYVSTVDSGNLAGHLLALASACQDWRERGWDPEAWRGGACDALALASEEAAHLSGAGALGAGLQELASRVVQAPTGGPDAGIEREGQALATLARALPAGQGADGTDVLFWATAATRCIASHQREPGAAVQGRLQAIEDLARSMALAMEFGFLRNGERKLLSIGFLVADGVLDANCYDLLASEARLASFVAIAKGDIPAREWFRLGRAVTPAAGGAALVSWSGSMFEYLMPSLVMRAPEGSLLAHTNRLVVQRQVAFGASHGVPWGVSESAYNVRDVEHTYQYSNFGIPGLGLKRGLDQDLVIAPYATALAAMVDPHAAVLNFAALAAAGGRGRYGFYEALDYTPARIPDGKAPAVVRAFMAHHGGMTIVAIADAVLGGIMRTRFHAEPMIQATELLLQEHAPRNPAIARPLPPDTKAAAGALDVLPPGGRRFSHADGPAPDTHLLSNGRYSVMLTAAGSGCSRWQGLAVTRWREDPTLDDWGSYIYLRDVRSGAAWSAGVQPIGAAPDEYDVAFTEDRAEFARRDGTLTTIMEVLVSSEEDAEVRRVSIANAGDAECEIELTSYAELALVAQAADVAHPAFAKLFVITEFLPESGAILATRRRRTPDEPEVWAAHLAVVENGHAHVPELETDRARFLGRGNTPRSPDALHAPLSGTTGTVLDAAFSMRARVRVPSGGMARVAFWTMAAASREAILHCVDKHRTVTAFDRAGTLAWTQAQVQLRHLGISAAEADIFQRLAGHLMFAGPAMRPSSSAILHGAGPQSGLWQHGISGDLPILLLRISDGADLDVARQVILAQEYFRLKRLAVDVVILNEHAASYAQDLQGALEAVVRAGVRASGRAIGGGGVFLLRADLLAPAACALLPAVARVVLVGNRGSVLDQLDRAPPARSARRVPLRAKPEAGVPAAPAPAAPAPAGPAIEFSNGLGGFAEDGREYAVLLGPGQATPAPWINVVANAQFGFQATEEGAGCTWAGNSRENQLTPWSNDAVSSRTGEAFYLRDDATGDAWHPTAAPRRDPAATYVARHGRGYSRFERVAHGIASSLLQFVAPGDPVKLSRLSLCNTSGQARSITVTAYVEWVLGPSRGATSASVTTELDAETGALFARNRWSGASGEPVAFAHLGGQTSWTGDRRAFIGRNGTLAHPMALAGPGPLDNVTGAGLDPCGALRTTIQLPPGGEAEVVFLLGQASGDAAARALVLHYRDADLDAVLAAVHRHWDGVLGAVQVRTPDRSMDIMLNGWLLYQTLACRVWARAGFYQASGAYGFRDQLQDGMALVASCPGLVREHLLRAAGRQFTAGDVQHWWLPQTGQGVRTRISDDCAWLAYAAAHYVAATSDAGVLDEPVPFLDGPALQPGEHDRFFPPGAADECATLFEHCARALDHSLALGAHGLPLMGTGDWNDGMSRVGAEGRGESVWLGWFLHTALLAFAPFAEARNDSRAAAWRAHAAALRPALEQAWDGAWYLRAFYDDGTPMGSHADAECRIDSIAQSWSVLSGAADPGRAALAMASVARDLLRVEDGLLLVLAPPFDRTAADPGYIKGYPPGIRENGGQYTHAALWSVMAFAALGDGNQAGRLFAMLNPINHALTPSAAARYKLEPYVVAADIYATVPHAGRGGWSWYTGSAGWMQRAGMESILGIRIRGALLSVDPCIPREWPGFEVRLAWRSARYVVTVDNPAQVCRGVAETRLDGMSHPSGRAVPLLDDGATHTVQVTLGPAPGA